MRVQVNAGNRNEGYVSVPGLPHDIMITNKEDKDELWQNR
jgi:hypothetical protein